MKRRFFNHETHEKARKREIYIVPFNPEQLLSNLKTDKVKKKKRFFGIIWYNTIQPLRNWKKII